MQSLACSQKLTVSQFSLRHVIKSNRWIIGQNQQSQSGGEGEMTQVEKICEKGKFSD